MTEVTARGQKRRVPRGLLGALVVFLLMPFPGVCLAGPLAGRLLLSRPRTLREWSWIGAAVLLIAINATAQRSVAQDLVLGYAFAFTGAFLALMVWRPGPLFPRVAVAAVDMATLLTVFAWAVGIDWQTVHAALETDFQQALTTVLSAWNLPPGDMTQMRASMSWLATVYPGIAVLGAMAGGALANALAWHISDGRSGDEPGRFRDFRFNDHLIWGVIVTLGLVLAPLPSPFSVLAGNMLMVWGGVYAARGTAVAAAVLSRWSLSLRLALCLTGALLLPYAAGALMLVGLADTWLNLRRIDAPPAQGVVP